jgi:hypothetical protein
MHLYKQRQKCNIRKFYNKHDVKLYLNFLSELCLQSTGMLDSGFCYTEFEFCVFLHNKAVSSSTRRASRG